MVASDPRGALAVWLAEIRVHHWVKNALVFLPLALTPQLLSLQSVLQSVLGFLALSMVCSGTYILNDLFDREADRNHSSKCRRPLASGRISVSSALLGAAILCGFGLLGAMALGGAFAAFLGVYVLLSLAYSYYLKTLVLLDLIILAAMYTLRIAMGVALIGGAYKPWLPVFIFLFFGGLSAIKRTAELVERTRHLDHSNNRRGYQPEDLPLLIALGVSFSIGALIVLGIFLAAVATPEAIYRSPERLWIAAALLLVWSLRFWVLAVRGALPHDPVLFSLRDRFSLILGGLVGLSIVGRICPDPVQVQLLHNLLCTLKRHL